MDFVYIEWHDAVKTGIDDWTPFDELPKPRLLYAHGLVAREDEEIVWLAVQSDPEDNSASGCIGIPKGMISKRIRLNKGGADAFNAGR